MKPSDFFSKEDKEKITRAIKEAELNTSGEVRVHIEGMCKGEVLDRAAYVFGQLNMHKTELRNGVLFYLAAGNKKFAILGDAGIHSKVPVDFWDEIKDLMLGHFKKDEFAEGLAKGIQLAGKQLRQHFPYQQDDVNELSDEISFGSK
jgi:uncharacterized membrane protein